MYENLAKELKKNIEVMTNTFEANNLQLLHLTVKPYSEEDADCSILVEVATISGTDIPRNGLNIKINLYDDNDELYLTEAYYINDESFSGYDTYEINCYDDSKTLKKAVKGRLYITRN